METARLTHKVSAVFFKTVMQQIHRSINLPLSSTTLVCSLQQSTGRPITSTSTKGSMIWQKCKHSIKTWFLNIHYPPVHILRMHTTMQSNKNHCLVKSLFTHHATSLSIRLKTIQFVLCQWVMKLRISILERLPFICKFPCFSVCNTV